MFDDSSEALLRVFRRMMEEARAMRHTCLGTEHLLIALSIRDSGDKPASIAWQTLYEHDLNPITLRVRVENSVGRGLQPSPSYLPITKRLKTVVEFAYRERRQFGADALEPEHLLLGLLRESEHSASPGIATVVLRQELGTSDIVSPLRYTVTRLLAMKRVLGGDFGESIVNRHELELWETLKDGLASLSGHELEKVRDRVVEAHQQIAKTKELLDTLSSMLQIQRESRAGN